MGTVCFVLFTALGSGLRSQAALQIENAALRHQLAVLQRQARGRPRLRPVDRLFWTWLCHLWPGWRHALVIVKPDTVLRWHRRGFRLYWRWKSRPRGPGRPRIPRAVQELIRQMCRANPTWGAPRIHGELLKLGITIAEATVGHYMVRCRPPPSQTWRTFLTNHVSQLVSVDFFVVPTFTFRVLFVFVVLAHDRRQILHVHVPRAPDGRVDGPTDPQCVPLGHSATVSAARSRRDLRRRVSGVSRRDGDRRGPDGAPESLAEPLGRATHRIDAPRVRRPRGCAQ